MISELFLLLAYAFFVPSVVEAFADMPLEATWYVPSPRKILVVVLVAYQVRAVLLSGSVPARTLVRQDSGGLISLAGAALLGLFLMHTVHGRTTGWLAERPPAVWLFDRTLPFPEFVRMSPMDAAQAPLHALVATLVDVVVIVVLGGTGYDLVVDGQRRRVIHGWLRQSTPYEQLVGIARKKAQFNTASGRRTWSAHRAVIERRSGDPLLLDMYDSFEDEHLDALAKATGLPRGNDDPAPPRADHAPEPRPLRGTPPPR